MAKDRTTAIVLSGCAGLLIGGVLLLALVAVVTISRDRQAARYPGSVVITSHSNYSGLPTQISWDNSYLTRDNFTDVYNWYSLTFDLGAESRAMGRCILLEGPQDQLVLTRYISVLVCNTDDGQRIYVTRSTLLNWPF